MWSITGLSLHQSSINHGFILREKHKGYHDRLSYSTCHGEKKHLKKLKKKKFTCTTEIKILEIHTYLLSSFNP